MKTNQELKTIIHQLSGVTYNEWVKIKMIVDGCFNVKEQEFKQKLELPTEEIDNVIHQRFE